LKVIFSGKFLRSRLFAEDKKQQCYGNVVLSWAVFQNTVNH